MSARLVCTGCYSPEAFEQVLAIFSEGSAGYELELSSQLQSVSKTIVVNTRILVRLVALETSSVTSCTHVS